MVEQAIPSPARASWSSGPLPRSAALDMIERFAVLNRERQEEANATGVPDTHTGFSSKCAACGLDGNLCRGNEIKSADVWPKNCKLKPFGSSEDATMPLPEVKYARTDTLEIA